MSLDMEQFNTLVEREYQDHCDRMKELLRIAYVSHGGKKDVNRLLSSYDVKNPDHISTPEEVEAALSRRFMRK